MALIIMTVFTILLIGTIITLMVLDNKRMEKIKKLTRRNGKKKKKDEEESIAQITTTG